LGKYKYLVAENESHEGKRREQSLWPIFRLHHQRSRYIYDIYYKRNAISKELYDYCIKEKWADPNLIAKWRKVFLKEKEMSSIHTFFCP